MPFLRFCTITGDESVRCVLLSFPNAIALLYTCSESRFYYVAPTSGRAGVEKVHSALSERGMRVISATEAPASYHENPFRSGQQSEMDLHLTEMSELQYMLYVNECSYLPLPSLHYGSLLQSIYVSIFNRN